MQSEESNYDLPSDGENEDEEHTLDSYQSTSTWTLEDIDKVCQCAQLNQLEINIFLS